MKRIKRRKKISKFSFRYFEGILENFKEIWGILGNFLNLKFYYLAFK
jgi:hypothetical protein